MESDGKIHDFSIIFLQFTIQLNIKVSATIGL